MFFNWLFDNFVNISVINIERNFIYTLLFTNTVAFLKLMRGTIPSIELTAYIAIYPTAEDKVFLLKTKVPGSISWAITL